MPPSPPPAQAPSEPPAPPGPDQGLPGEPPPPGPPRTRWLVLWFLLVGVPLPMLAGTSSLLATLVLVQLSYALPALLWAVASGFRPWRLLRLGSVSPAGLLLGAGTGLACILAGSGAQALWRAALPQSLVERFNLGNRLAVQLWSPWLLLGTVALLPALCEELGFRGGLQSALMGRRSPFRAVWGAAVIFAALHFDPVRFPAVLLLGLAFGWLTWRTGSIWPSALAHLINNGAAVALLSLADAPEAVDPAAALPGTAATALLLTGGGLFALLVGAANRQLPPAPAAASFLLAPDEALVRGAST